MIALVDYGAGNVRSVYKALETVGAEVEQTRDPEVVRRADKVVLPGVGAFADCMAGLQAPGLDQALKEIVQRGVPLLGICVGMQVLFEVGEEMGEHRGLGMLPGRVVRFDVRIVTAGLKIPHTGWNTVVAVRPNVLFRGLAGEMRTYFNHAYYCQARPEDVLGVTDYGGNYCSVVNRGNLYGIQFHPEKSQAAGLQILRNFVECVA